MVISKKHSEAARKNIEKVNKTGRNRRFGKDNCKWKGGKRLVKNHPCPKCGKDRNCEKRDAYRLCWNCHIERPSRFSRKEWHKKTKAETKKWAMKQLGGKCLRCKVSDLPSVCYQFHHVDKKTKKYNVGGLIRQKPSERLKKELKKCVLLCANCHMIIEHADS